MSDLSDCESDSEEEMLSNLESNNHREFVGLQALVARHKEQIEDFEAWAAARNWSKFHHSHYDWWAFPIGDRSSYGYKYVVKDLEVAKLKRSPGFMRRMARGTELLSLSWGWNLYEMSWIATPDRGQTWQHWGVRLFKACKSAYLFDLRTEGRSLLKLGLLLLSHGCDLSYGSHDFGSFFTNHPDNDGTLVPVSAPQHQTDIVQREVERQDGNDADQNNVRETQDDEKATEESRPCETTSGPSKIGCGESSRAPDSVFHRSVTSDSQPSKHSMSDDGAHNTNRVSEISISPSSVLLREETEVVADGCQNLRIASDLVSMEKQRKITDYYAPKDSKWQIYDI